MATKLILWGLALLSLPLLGLTCVSLSEKLPPSGAPGRPAPAFVLPRLDADGHYGTPDLKDKLVIVTFWASWCRPCAQEALLLENTWRRHRHEGLVVLGVNLADGRAEAVGFLDDHGITYPNVADTATVAGAFGVTAVPETYFLDARGRVVSVNRGYEVEIDERHGMVLRQPIFPTVLDRQVLGLFATRRSGPAPTTSSVPTTLSAVAPSAAAS